MMRIIECTQGTQEWLDAHVGIPSASQFSKIITPKGKLSSQAKDLIASTIAGTLWNGSLSSTLMTRPMADGLNLEPDARAWYELQNDCEVREVGFCVSDDERFGCSPDGLVGDDGGIEIKCPLAKTHVGYMLAGGLPEAYKAQVHGSLIVTGRAWWDFMSYSYNMPPIVVRVVPDAFTDELRAVLELFYASYSDALTKIHTLCPPPADVDPEDIFF